MNIAVDDHMKHQPYNLGCSRGTFLDVDKKIQQSQQNNCSLQLLKLVIMKEQQLIALLMIT